MSLRRRMVVLTATAVAFAVVLSAVACYVAVRSSMRGRLDHQLRVQASLIAAASSSGAFPITRPRPRSRLTPAQVQIPRPSLQNQGDLALLSASGTLYKRPDDQTRFTVTPHDLAVARGQAKAYFRDGQVGGTAVRLYVARAGTGHAVMVEQAVTDLNSTLHDLALILVAIAVAGVAIAGLLGLFVARAAAAPVHVLRRAAEHVQSTGDLSRRISVQGTDDLGRLGQSFNGMLSALEDSQRAQRQLVADASHELRTPVATIRTNLEVLARNPDLPAEERAPLLRDLIGESAELGALVEDLLESARESSDGEPLDTVALDAVVTSELERWSRRHPGLMIVPRLEPTVILARESRLRRALGNLLDNAIKWSPAGTIEVTLSEGTLTVRDHGPGFASGDLPHVFDRFYRAASARTVPGSGLGLSIVRKVAEEHGGVARASNASDGGAIVSITFPLLEAAIDDSTRTTVGAEHIPLPEHAR
jgi:two-component system, OmpR family, sensor histidine kinase MprB